MTPGPPVIGLAALALSLIPAACSDSEMRPPAVTPYASPSRFTDPREHSPALDVLPRDPIEIAAVARNLTVHHNLLAHLDVPRDQWSRIPSVWPPNAPEIPVRIRAGYFRDVYKNEDHLIAFWERNARAKGIANQLLEENAARWREANHDYTRQQVKVNKCVEHWAVQYWDEEQTAWRLLDANTTFLKAMADIDVGFHLPRRHFEFAHESWHQMRTAADRCGPNLTRA